MIAARRAGILTLLVAVIAGVSAMPRRMAAQGAAAAATTAREADALARRADALVEAGLIFRAESLYYDAVRIAPRNAAVRASLGGFLADRGALRIGARLLEEARTLGGDADVLARRLAPIYARLQDPAALAALPRSPLSPLERERVAWLAAHPPMIIGPDSIVVRLTALTRDPFGQIRILVGDDTLEARVDAAVRGLVLDTAWARREQVHVFSAPARSAAGSTRLGVVEDVRIDSLWLGALPVSFAVMTSPREAIVGLDVLEPFTPTFAPRAGALVLRQRVFGGSVAVPQGDHVPIVMRRGDIAIVRSGQEPPFGSLALLVGRQWTLEWRRGEVIVGP